MLRDAVLRLDSGAEIALVINETPQRYDLDHYRSGAGLILGHAKLFAALGLFAMLLILRKSQTEDVGRAFVPDKIAETQ